MVPGPWQWASRADLGAECVSGETKEKIMASPSYASALIVGAGQGLSASLTRLLRNEGFAVAIAARDGAKLEPLCIETGARA